MHSSGSWTHVPEVGALLACLVDSTTTCAEKLEHATKLVAWMPGLPLPSAVTARRVKTHWFYWVARSKPGRCLIILLIAIPVLYILHISASDRPYYGDASKRGELRDIPELVDEVSLTEPLSPLGLEADKTFHLGSTSKERYKAELEQFATRTFPNWLRKRAHKSIELYLGDSVDITRLPSVPHKIYQTAKREPYWTDQRLRSWQGIPGYEYHFFDDPKADKWVRRTFGGTEVELVWNKLGTGVKRADLLRYLLVMVEGGIYSDMDTVRLKPISKWGDGANFNGPEVTNPPSVFVGIEADVGNRPDWHKWWPRPLQIVQWTFAAAPLHPILIDTIRRVHHITATLQTAKAKTKNFNISETQWVGGERLNSDEEISVMEWTGPGVFTDSVIRYITAKYGVTWPMLKDLRQPVRIRDTVVLPITGFSPGVRLFGAGETTDREAMVYHMFAGSWKKEPQK